MTEVAQAAPTVAPIIEAVFGKLLLVYGSARLAAVYRGQEIETIKRHWAHELRGVSANDIAYALANLPPDMVPNVLQFRAACMRAPLETYRRIEAPTPSPEQAKRMAALLEAIAQRLSGRGGTHPKAWAVKLKARHESGERIPRAHVRMYRDALGLDK